MFNKTFWKLALERAIKSFAQTFVAILSVQSTMFENAPWWTAASTAAVAFVLSVMTSIGSITVGPDGDPGMVAHQPVTAPPAGGDAPQVAAAA